jgi:hypothetical protein
VITSTEMIDDDDIARADIAMRHTPIGRAIHRFLLDEMIRASQPGYSPTAPTRLLCLMLPGLGTEPP